MLSAPARLTCRVRGEDRRGPAAGALATPTLQGRRCASRLRAATQVATSRRRETWFSMCQTRDCRASADLRVGLKTLLQTA